MAHDTRRCALAGCDVWIEDIPGRPARRYCTAAHRSAARQARRAALAHSPDQQLAATLPWLREPDPAPLLPAGRQVSPRGVGDRPDRGCPAVRHAPGVPGLGAPTSRRRRALAVLGAAGILVGGYAVTSAGPSEPRQPDAGDDLAGDDWARDARVALASTNRQLETIAEVQTQWMELSEAQRAADRAGPAEALTERRDVLERRRATLSSQLDTYESLDEVRSGLADTEQDLAEIERALAAEPSTAPGTDSSLTALSEQRDIVLLQRAARLQELAAMEGGIEEAAAQPLPDDAEQTTQVRDQVLDVIRAERSPTPEPRLTGPDAVLGDQNTKPTPEIEDGVLAAPGLGDGAPPVGAEQAADGVVDTIEEHARGRKADPPADSPEAPVLADPHGADPHVDAAHDADPHDADPHDADPHDDAAHDADPHVDAAHDADPHVDAAQEVDPVETLVDTVEGVVESPGGRHRREEVPTDEGASAVPVDGPVGEVVDLVVDLIDDGVRTEIDGDDGRGDDGRGDDGRGDDGRGDDGRGDDGRGDDGRGDDGRGDDGRGDDGRSAESEPVELIIGTLDGLTGSVSDDDSRAGSDRAGSDRVEADEPHSGNTDDAFSTYQGVLPEIPFVLGRSDSSRSGDRLDGDSAVADRDVAGRGVAGRDDADVAALGQIIDLIEGMATGEMGPLLETAVDEAFQGGDGFRDTLDDVVSANEHDRSTVSADPEWLDEVTPDAVERTSAEQDDSRLVSEVRAGADSPAAVLDASDLFRSYDDLELEALNEAGERGSGDFGVAETTTERDSGAADERVGSGAVKQ